MDDRCPTDVKYEFHGMGYQSPVEQICKNIEVKLENDIYKQVMYYGVHVDKDELMKALKYDRDQYKKGFFDGLAAQRKYGRWIEHHEPFSWMGFTTWTCSECDYEVGYEKDIKNITNYCPNCGAKMDERSNER